MSAAQQGLERTIMLGEPFSQGPELALGPESVVFWIRPGIHLVKHYDSAGHDARIQQIQHGTSAAIEITVYVQESDPAWVVVQPARQGIFIPTSHQSHIVAKDRLLGFLTHVKFTSRVCLGVGSCADVPGFWQAHKTVQAPAVHVMEIGTDELHALASIHTKLHDVTSYLGPGHGLQQMTFAIDAFAFEWSGDRNSTVENVNAVVVLVYDQSSGLCWQ